MISSQAFKPSLPITLPTCLNATLPTLIPPYPHLTTYFTTFCLITSLEIQCIIQKKPYHTPKHIQNQTNICEACINLGSQPMNILHRERNQTPHWKITRVQMRKCRVVLMTTRNYTPIQWLTCNYTSFVSILHRTTAVNKWIIQK